MQRFRPRRPSAALVISILALFVALGGASYAATQLPKNSVGAKQLKKNAVATAKVRKNAVTRAKIKASAVNSSKIANGSIKGRDINAPSTPFSQVVFTTQGQGTVAVPKEGIVNYPLDPASYTQAANRTDTYAGAVEVVFKPTCTAPRAATAFVLVDPADPLSPSSDDIVAIGVAEDKAGGEVAKRVNLAPYYVGGIRFRRATPTNHTLFVGVASECAEGKTEGVEATSAEVDVIGTR